MINRYYQFFMVKGGLDRRGICSAIRKQVATLGANWLRWGAFLYFFRRWTHKGGGGRTYNREKPPWTNTTCIQGQFYEFHNVACPDFPPSVQSPYYQNWWFWRGSSNSRPNFTCLKSLDLFLPEISLTLVIPDWWVS